MFLDSFPASDETQRNDLLSQSARHFTCLFDPPVIARCTLVHSKTASASNLCSITTLGRFHRDQSRDFPSFALVCLVVFFRTKFASDHVFELTPSRRPSHQHRGGQLSQRLMNSSMPHAVSQHFRENSTPPNWEHLGTKRNVTRSQSVLFGCRCLPSRSTVSTRRTFSKFVHSPLKKEK